MFDIIRLILPIYIVIAIGFVVVRSGYVRGTDLRAAGVLVLKLFLPAVVFLAISANDVSESLRPDLLLAYGLASVLALGATYLMARAAGKPHGVAAFEGLGASGSNSAFFGLPIITLVVGADVALRNFAAVVLVENILLLPLAITLIEVDGGFDRRRLWLMMTGLARNPILIAAALGLAWALAGLTLPEIPAQVLAMMAPVAAPVALLTIGGAVSELQARAQRWGVVRVTVGKLVVHPLCMVLAVWLMTPLFGPMPADVRIAGILNAGLPMMVTYMLFGSRFGREDVAATSLICATILSFLTLSAILTLLG